MERESFKSRLGFLLVSAGCAIGIGNVWKFPFITGQNGGGVFVFFYLLFLVIMGAPVLRRMLSADDVLHNGLRLDAGLFREVPDRKVRYR